MRDGFTLVETLIALVMASILLSVSASALMKILRAEVTASKMQQASLAMQTIGCRAALGDEEPADLPRITLRKHALSVAGAEWAVWDITCTSAPSFSATLEYPVPAP